MIPKFAAVDFVSFYIEIPVMIVMYIAWMLIVRPGYAAYRAQDAAQSQFESGSLPSPNHHRVAPWRWWHSDLVNTKLVDLRREEYEEGEIDKSEEQERERRVSKPKGVGLFWRIYYLLV